MRWLIKDLTKVHPVTRKYLAAATPSYLGDFMTDAARHCMRRGPGKYLAIALFSGNTLLGWAMLDFLLSRNSSFVRTYIYVKPKYRRRGYGTKILEKARAVAKRRGRGIRVCPWNDRSRKFFRSVNITRSEVAPGYVL